MSIIDSIRRFFERQSDASRDTDADRIDNMTALRASDQLQGGEHGGVPPNYLPTGVDERRPRK